IPPRFAIADAPRRRSLRRRTAAGGRLWTFPLQGKVKIAIVRTTSRSRMRRRCLMTVQPDAGEAAEQRRELRPIGVRQRRLEQRGDVAAQMRRVAGAEQHDVDTRLMARETV